MKADRKGIFKGYSKFDKKNFLFVYLLILLPVAQFIVFWAYINFSSIMLAFRNSTGQWTLQNFKVVFGQFFKNKTITDETLAPMIGRSFLLWAVGNFVAFPIGLCSTYVLYRRVAGHYAFRVIFSIAGIVGGVIWTSIVINSCNPDGILQYILTHWLKLNLSDAAKTNGLFLATDTAFPTILIIGFFNGIVGGSVIVTGAYTKVPPELVEAAKLDGLDFWGTFLHVVLPCSWPTLQTILTVSLCGMLVSEGNVYLYTKGTGAFNTATMGYYLYILNLDISQNPMTANYNMPAALGLTISAISIPLVLLGRKLLNRILPNVEV